MQWGWQRDLVKEEDMEKAKNKTKQTEDMKGEQEVQKF